MAIASTGAAAIAQFFTTDDLSGATVTPFPGMTIPAGTTLIIFGAAIVAQAKISSSTPPLLTLLNPGIEATRLKSRFVGSANAEMWYFHNNGAPFVSGAETVEIRVTGQGANGIFWLQGFSGADHLLGDEDNPLITLNENFSGLPNLIVNGVNLPVTANDELAFDITCVHFNFAQHTPINPSQTVLVNFGSLGPLTGSVVGLMSTVVPTAAPETLNLAWTQGLTYWVMLGGVLKPGVAGTTPVTVSYELPLESVVGGVAGVPYELPIESLKGIIRLSQLPVERLKFVSRQHQIPLEFQSQSISVTYELPIELVSPPSGVPIYAPYGGGQVPEPPFGPGGYEFDFDASQYVGYQFRLAAMLDTSNPGLKPARARLFNLTDDLPVGGSEITRDEVTAALVISGDFFSGMPQSLKRYQLQIGGQPATTARATYMVLLFRPTP